MKSFSNVFFALLMLLIAAPVMAYDSEGCSNFSLDTWGANVECLGYLELSDMGEFDTNDYWEWKAQFADMEITGANGLPADVAFHNGWLPALAALTPVKGATEIMNFGLDNRRKANGVHDSRVKFQGVKNSVMIPKIVALRVNDPGNICSTDPEYNNWDFQECPSSDYCTANSSDYRCSPVYTGNYPKIIYQFQADTDEECLSDCGGWVEEGCGDSCTKVAMRFVADPTIPSEPIAPSDVVSVEWVEGAEVTTDFANEIETFYYSTYNTGMNIVQGNGLESSAIPTLYSKPFSVAAPLGENTYRVHLVNEEHFDFQINVASDTLMPTVAAKTYYEDLVVDTKQSNSKKSKKKIKATLEMVEADNITAREIIADDGNARLVIQWAEPDRAMELVSNGNVRLRIWVGPGWFNDNINNDVPSTSTFLWMDVPLHTGSVVVPAGQYAWIKQFAVNGELPIAGMYREQFNGYQNRGYFEGIRFMIP